MTQPPAPAKPRRLYVPAVGPRLRKLLFVVFGLFRFLYILHTTDEGESPESIMIKDLPLVLNVALWFITAVVVLSLNR